MRIPTVLILASLAFAVLAAPVASADVVVGVWTCDVEEQVCWCQDYRVPLEHAHVHEGCTFW